MNNADDADELAIESTKEALNEQTNPLTFFFFFSLNFNFIFDFMLFHLTLLRLITTPTEPFLISMLSALYFKLLLPKQTYQFHCV